MKVQGCSSRCGNNPKGLAIQNSAHSIQRGRMRLQAALKVSVATCCPSTLNPPTQVKLVLGEGGEAVDESDGKVNL